MKSGKGWAQPQPAAALVETPLGGRYQPSEERTLVGKSGGAAANGAAASAKAWYRENGR